ncbi:hypothetical protein ACVWZ6_000164 [Bradyrhizobium sp. GM6.1]
MGIAESQLTTWSAQGSVKQSRDTYASVRGVLEDSNAPYSAKTYETFLQGSYGNDTNVYADSDVDVVMRLDSIFYYDLSRMTESERTEYEKNFGDGQYSVGQFKTEVLGWLKKNYGESVKLGKKALFIPSSGNRRDTDVLVCAQFRRYHKFAGPNDQKYDVGICFFLSDNTRIENFPKQHSTNCTEKHKATNQWFKPSVRMFKNMRNRMIERGELAEGVAPSCYLEGMLYNVPADKFGSSYQDTFTKCYNWIVQTDSTKLVCAN